jgi:hypothetical protein
MRARLAGTVPGTPASVTSTPFGRYPKIARPAGAAWPPAISAEPTCIVEEPAVDRLLPPEGIDTGAVIGDVVVELEPELADVEVEPVDVVLLEEPVVVVPELPCVGSVEGDVGADGVEEVLPELVPVLPEEDVEPVVPVDEPVDPVDVVPEVDPVPEITSKASTWTQ